MKTKLTALCLALLAPAAVFAAAGHDHDHAGHSHAPAAKKVAGPNGGRILKEVEPHAELFVTAERKVKLTFLDDAGKAAPAPAGATATAITGDRSAPTTLEFELVEGALVSKTALPEGQNLPAIVTIRAGAEAKPVRARLQINLSVCGGCQLAEYACTCGH